MAVSLPQREQDYGFKSFTLDDYLKDDAPFKIGLEFDGNGKGLLAIGLNGKNVYRVKPKYQTSEQQNYALFCRPIMYLDWLNANLDDILSPNREITKRPGIDFIRELRRGIGVKDNNNPGIQTYIRISNRHLMLPDGPYHQLFFLRDMNTIEVSWDEGRFSFYERGIERVPVELFEQKIKEVLGFYKEVIKSKGFGYSLANNKI